MLLLSECLPKLLKQSSENAGAAVKHCLVSARDSSNAALKWISPRTCVDDEYLARNSIP